MCPDHVPWSIRVKRSWETLSNASARAEQGVTLLKYSNAMRYIHSGSGRESYLPKEILCLFLCGLPPRRISCKVANGMRNHRAKFVNQYSCIWRTLASTIDRGREPCRPR